jgi:hypothetical protein
MIDIATVFLIVTFCIGIITGTILLIKKDYGKSKKGFYGEK